MKNDEKYQPKVPEDQAFPSTSFHGRLALDFNNKLSNFTVNLSISWSVTAHNIPISPGLKNEDFNSI